MNAATPFVKIPQAWEYYHYYQGGAVKAHIEFDRQAAFELEHKGYSSGFRVVFFVEPEVCDALGMPLAEAEKSLEDVQQGLIDFLNLKKSDCRLVARITIAGMRELVFQAASRKDFLVQVSPWTKTSALDPELREYEDWIFFDEQVRPDETMLQQINDRNGVERLVQQGKKRGEPMQFALSFSGNDETLSIVHDELIRDGFLPLDKQSGFLKMKRTLLLGELEMFRLSMALIAFCKEAGARYEGWEAL